MSDKGWSIAGVIASVVFGVPAWWTLFIEHPETVTALWVIAPLGTFALGAFTGYHARRWRDDGREKATDGAAKTITLDDVRAAEDRARARANAELASIAAERDALRSERDELVAKVGRLRKVVEAGERAVGNAYCADMMADYEESGIGRVGASPVDAAGIVETGEAENGEHLV